MNVDGLLNKISVYTNPLSESDRVHAMRAVATSIFGKDLVGYLSHVNKISDKDHKDNFRTVVKPIISHNEHVARLWRASVSSLQNKGNWRLGANQFNVDPTDLSVLWSSLDTQYKLKVLKIAKSTQLLSFMNRSEWNKLLKDLVSFSKSMAYRLRFIADSDCSITLEDLQQELLRHGIQAAKGYEHFSNRDGTRNIDKIRTHAQRAMKNHRVNMIYYYTRGSRARVERTTSGCGQCSFCKSDVPSRCTNEIIEFRNTTISLDTPFSDDPSSGNGHNIIGDDESTSTNLVDDEFVDILYDFIDDELICKFLDVVLDRVVDPGFEEWAKTKRDSEKIHHLASTYFNIPMRKVRKSIKAALEDYRASTA